MSAALDYLQAGTDIKNALVAASKALASASSTRNQFTFSGSTVTCVDGDLAADGWVAGMLMEVTGTISNDGVYPIKTVATLVITVEGGFAFTDEVVTAPGPGSTHLTNNDPESDTEDFWQIVAEELNDNHSSAAWRQPVTSLLATPPGGPTTGDRYIVVATATGDWAGHEDEIAEWNGSSWDFFTPIEGWAAYVENVDDIYVYTGSAWVAVVIGSAPVDSVFGRTGAVAAQSGDYTAGEVTLTPYGSVGSTDVQGGIEELEDEVDGVQSGVSANATAISNHLSDAIDAHDASAISAAMTNTWHNGFVPAGTDVDTILEQIVDDLADDVGTTTDGASRIGVEADDNVPLGYARGSLRDVLGDLLTAIDRHYAWHGAAHAYMSAQVASTTPSHNGVLGTTLSTGDGSESRTARTDSDGVWFRLNTGTTSGNWAAVGQTQSSHEWLDPSQPFRSTFRVKLASQVSSIRIWLGFVEKTISHADLADTDGAALGSSADYVGFRLNPTSDTTWHCVSENSGSQDDLDTNHVGSANGVYELTLEGDGSQIEVYTNGVHRGTLTEIPGELLRLHISVTTLTNAQRQLFVGHSKTLVRYSS